jgi:hypothetical protein
MVVVQWERERGSKPSPHGSSIISTFKSSSMSFLSTLFWKWQPVLGSSHFLLWERACPSSYVMLWKSDRFSSYIYIIYLFIIIFKYIYFCFLRWWESIRVSRFLIFPNSPGSEIG